MQTQSTFANNNQPVDPQPFNGNTTTPYQFAQAQPWEMGTNSFTPKPYERHNRRVIKDSNYQQGSYKPIEVAE